MNTTTVYRVEHPVTGNGPWQRNSEKEKSLTFDQKALLTHAVNVLDHHWDTDAKYSSRHRPIQDDFGLNWHFSATESLELLREWFAVSDDIINALCDAGYTVIEYTVDADNVWHSRSGRQVGVDLNHALSHRDLTILALIED